MDPREKGDATAAAAKAKARHAVSSAAIVAASAASPLDVPFEEAARIYAANSARGWKRGVKAERDWLASLEAYAFGDEKHEGVGRKRIRDITVDDVLAVMRRAEDGVRKNDGRAHDGTETRKRLRIKVRSIIASAIARDKSEVRHRNPADAERIHASDRSMKPAERDVHFRRIDLGDAPTTYQQVEERQNDAQRLSDAQPPLWAKRALSPQPPALFDRAQSPASDDRVRTPR